MAWGQEPGPVKQFPAATKRFVNQTGGYVQVTLVVRSGDDPSKPPFKVVPFDIDAGKEVVQQYGDGNNPYLNNIEVKLILSGNLAVRANLVIARGSPVDVDYNTHDTMVFMYKSSAILLEVRNQGASAAASVGNGVTAGVGGQDKMADPRRYEFAKRG